jgi:hypothetical protein
MAAAPVWKIAYRLVLSREGEKARLQGWAMVENLTGGDWNDIELVLISLDLAPSALHSLFYRSDRGAGDNLSPAATAHR